mmetsp:Transcript_62806/g.180087  ORF Transcript_62806/g.180087 Transcript_62806/m.180087 type:complete len:270 (-) Transcript_62806:33-842(-)
MTYASASRGAACRSARAASGVRCGRIHNPRPWCNCLACGRYTAGRCPDAPGCQRSRCCAAAPPTVAWFRQGSGIPAAAPTLARPRRSSAVPKQSRLCHPRLHYGCGRATAGRPQPDSRSFAGCDPCLGQLPGPARWFERAARGRGPPPKPAALCRRLCRRYPSGVRRRGRRWHRCCPCRATPTTQNPTAWTRGSGTRGRPRSRRLPPAAQPPWRCAATPRQGASGRRCPAATTQAAQPCPGRVDGRPPWPSRCARPTSSAPWSGSPPSS